jgi:hypothetical protein
MEAFRMLGLAFGGLIAQAVYVAAKLGLADLLAGGPRTAEELAAASGAHPRSLARLLRALSSFEVFAERDDGRFELNALGATLRSDGPGSVRAAVIQAGDPTSARACVEMLHSVRTGTPAFDRVFGRPFFDYLAAHPESGAMFDAGMANFSDMENAPIAQSYDFSGARRVVDVGGGHGGFLAEILRANPTLHGVLYDQAQVVRDAPFIHAAGVTDRCTIVAGDFFVSIPAGGDVYVLKRILHDWDDDTCVGMLRRCREAMGASGRVLVVDAVVPPGNDPHPSKVSDLLMLVVLPGRERTAVEFRSLFEDAGLALTRIVPTPTMLSIVEGVPA